MNAPLLLFVYNRPDHTRRTLESIRSNLGSQATRLVVFADGAKEGASAEELRRIDAVRRVITEEDWCGTVELHASGENNGLAANVISGVTQVLSSYGRVVVLEDDLVCTPHFLSFMNRALDTYEDDERVISTTAYIYPVKTVPPETFFLRGADCWGWATWRRGWELFEPDGAKLLSEIERRDLAHDFDFGGAYPYTQMLRDQVRGANNSWAIRWYASAYLRNKLTLYPGRSLVTNIGLDGSGTHSGVSDRWQGPLAENEPSVGGIPVEENQPARAAVADFFRDLGSDSTTRGVRSKLRRMLLSLK